MQQINLYQPLFRREEKVFSARTMFQGALLVLVGILLFYAYAHWQARAVTAQLAQMEQQRNGALQQLADLSRTFPERHKDLALEREISRLRSQLSLKQQVAAHLAEQGDTGNIAGYVDHLEGLARQRPDQTWLSRISIQAGGRELLLAGSTHIPEQVPRYLQLLTAETSLNGSRFRHFAMTRNEKDDGRIDFELATTRTDKE